MLIQHDATLFGCEERGRGGLRSKNFLLFKPVSAERRTKWLVLKRRHETTATTKSSSCVILNEYSERWVNVPCRTIQLSEHDKRVGVLVYACACCTSPFNKGTPMYFNPISPEERQLKIDDFVIL